METTTVHVLVVEGDEADVELIRHAFAAAAGRFRLTVARNLREARTSLAQSSPDLIVTDLLLPDGLGTELLPTENEAPSYPVVVMSNGGSERVAVEATKAGAQMVKSAATLSELPRLAERVLREWSDTAWHRQSGDALNEGQSQVLEMIAKNAPLNETLSRLMQVIEAQADGMFCSVLLLDEDGLRLRHGAAPSLPEDYNRLADGHVIGPQAGSCGTAAYRREAVFVTDTRTDPLWAPYRDIAAQFGLGACWSTPIFSYEGKLLGTFAMYYRQPRTPSATEIRLIEIATHIAGIAIERKRAQEEREKAHAQLLSTLESFTDGFVILDHGWRFTYLNPAAERILGMSREELLGKCHWDVCPFTVGTEIERHYRRALETRKPAELEYHHLPGRQGDRWFGKWYSLKALPTDDGRLSVYIRDITEQKRAEEALRESEARYRTLVEQATDGIFITDAQGHYVDVNTSGCSMLGYTGEEILRLQIRDVVADEEMARIARELNRLRHDAPVMTEWKMKRKDGTSFYGEVTAKRMPDDRLLGILRDITERKRAEDALRHAEEKYRHIFEDSVEGIFQSSPDGQLLTANPALARMLGYDSPGTLIASTHDIGQQLYVEAQQRKEFQHLLEANDIVAGFECRLYRRDGSAIWVTENAHAVRDPAGKLLYYEGTLLDITERKSLEAQLRQAQKMEAIGTLSGGIAHDFNNLLTVIKGYASMLREGTPEDSELRSYAQKIDEATERAVSLTRQLLAFSRQQVLHPTVFNLNTLVVKLDAMLQRLIGEDIEMRTITAPNLGSVKADPGQIEQVIMNLVVNARDAMPKGGKLILETANVELDGAYAREHVGVCPGVYTMLAVSDTGVGMDPETQAHIFEPFFTTKEIGRGTGLGLAMVYGIVKQSGGNLWVYSERGRGTTLKVYLPQVQERAETMPERQPVDTKTQGTETVLLVEDDRQVREYARSVLTSCGYSVLVAEDARTAPSLSEQYGGPIHLLLTDVVMPGMSGRELVQELITRRPDLKVLFMSGYTTNSIVHHGVLDAGTFFLPKPFTPAALAAKVREALGAPDPTSKTSSFSGSSGQG